MKLNQYEWDPDKDWIGRGAFAEVFRARDNMDNYVALKSYTEALMKEGSEGSFKSKYSLEAEFKKGRDLAHTNVIRYIGLDFIVHTDHMQRQSSYPVLIMEYADGGNLEERIRRAYPTATDENTLVALGFDETLTIIKEILEGLAYMHSQDIIHRDLKPANILFKIDRKGHPVVKITDFGISRDNLASNLSESMTAGVGTASYMAPEQFLKKTYGLNGTISNRTDVWAVGVILYRMLTGRLPFIGRDYEEVQEAVINTEPDYNKVPVQFHAVIKGCLQKHASKRLPDATTVLKMLNGEITPPPTQRARPSQPPPSAQAATPSTPAPESPPQTQWRWQGLVFLVIVAFVFIIIIPIMGRGCNGSGSSGAADSVATTDSVAKYDSTAKMAADTMRYDTTKKDTTMKK